MPRVGIIVEGIDAGNYVAVVDEDKGFTLDAVYREQALENKARFDFAIPGRYINTLAMLQQKYRIKNLGFAFAI